MADLFVIKPQKKLIRKNSKPIMVSYLPLETPRSLGAIPLPFLTISTRPRPTTRSALISHTKPGTQSQKHNRLRRSEIIQRIEQNLQMPGEMVFILLQNRKQLI